MGGAVGGGVELNSGEVDGASPAWGGGPPQAVVGANVSTQPRRPTRAPSTSSAGPPPHTGEDFTPVPTRQRDDGWSPARQRAFLEALASCGSVSAAARVVGLSRESAYALRRRADARGFGQAWDAARLLAAEHLLDLAWDRATQGEVRSLVYHGAVVGEVRHYDNRLLLGLIAQNRKVLVEQGLVAPPQVTAAVALDWEAALGRAERGEALDLPAPDEGVPDVGGPVAAPDRGGDQPQIAPPLPPEHDARGEAMTERQQLSVGFYAHWWDEEQDCWLTNWPAPEDWAGREFRLDAVDAEAELIERNAEDPDLDSAGEAWPELEFYARDLSPAEAAGLAAADDKEAAARAARLELYRRDMFGLTSAAERASIHAANRWDEGDEE